MNAITICNLGKIMESKIGFDGRWSKKKEGISKAMTKILGKQVREDDDYEAVRKRGAE